MSISPTSTEIAIRLAFTLLAGAVIGFNRDEHGRPAGLRTTLLVCLAAATVMIQTNLLLGTGGRAPDSFVTFDVMRLPLGVLSGIGFIGGGVILKRGDLVRGVTTAATMWFVTILGLCFGGGEIGLGLVSLALGIVVLWGLERIETRIPRERTSSLTVNLDKNGPDEGRFLAIIDGAGFRVVDLGMSYDRLREERIYECKILWRSHRREVVYPPFLEDLTREPGVSSFRWNHDESNLPSGE